MCVCVCVCVCVSNKNLFYSSIDEAIGGNPWSDVRDESNPQHVSKSLCGQTIDLSA